MKKITLKQIGYRFDGVATINLWGGGKGEIKMDSWDIKGKFNEKKMREGINDGQFGCESIEKVVIRAYNLYPNGYTEYEQTFIVEKDNIPIHCKRGI